MVTAFDSKLVRRYDVPGPRYTSYPTALQFGETFGPDDFRAAALGSNEEPVPRSLSVYVHIPFCRQLCYYCGCNKKITQRQEAADLYLDRLEREIDMLGPLFDADRQVLQLHLGGGSPTFLSTEQRARLMTMLRGGFPFAADFEAAIEVDPRTATDVDLTALRSQGFNRLSFGIQDLDPQVQSAINRVQDNSHALGLLDEGRNQGYSSVSVDLIYGLPHQNPAGWRRTLAAVIDARPDRLAIYSYAHLPQRFKAQRLLPAFALPSGDDKLELLEIAVETLTDAGYEYIGMDHFALPEDELARARGDGSLHRNFQGYSTRGGLDLIGLGVSAISMIGDAYSQNDKSLPSYYRRIDAGELPTERGVVMHRDDRLRRAVIQTIMCQGELVFAAVESRWDIDFKTYFGPALLSLETLVHDGLVRLTPSRLEVTPRGWFLLRAIAMCFDAYLPQTQKPAYSTVI